eukprot:14333-Heterococcus_DN1.PRE.2
MEVSDCKLTDSCVSQAHDELLHVFDSGTPDTAMHSQGVHRQREITNVMLRQIVHADTISIAASMSSKKRLRAASDKFCSIFDAGFSTLAARNL